MNYIKKAFLLIAVLLAFISSAQIPVKEEAKNAFLEITKTLMKSDCNKYISYYNDSLKLIGGKDDLYSKKKIRGDAGKICSQIAIDFTNNSDSLYTNYLSNFDVITFSRKEFLDTITPSKVMQMWKHISKTDLFIFKVLEKTPKHYNDNDFLVFGNVTRSSKNIEPPGSITWYFYVLRKTKAGWKIFACPSNPKL